MRHHTPQPDDRPDDADASGVERDFALDEAELGPGESGHVHIDERARIACDERGVLRSGRLKGLTMWGAILVLAWPVLVESFLNALVGMVDTIIAARISPAATDAIGIASYFQWFMGMLSIALGVGATALVSRAAGRGRTAFAGVVFGQVVTLGVVIGTVAGVGIFALAPQIAMFLRLEPGEEAYRHTVEYLRIVSLATPALLVLFGGIACSRGVGESLKPMLIMALVNAVNMGVSVVLAGVAIDFTPPGAQEPLFVIPALVDEGWGVRGIATGTLVAWWVGALLVIGLLLRGVHGVRLRPRRLRPHASTAMRLVRVGLPNFIETAGMWLGNFIVLTFLALAGATTLFGAHVIAIRVEAFSFMPGFAMATAAATLTGQYLGAKRPDLARRAIRRCTGIACAIMGAQGVLFVLAPESIVSVFSSQPEHQKLVPPLLITCGIIQVFFATAIVVRGALRGAGDTRTTMVITWISVWAIRLPLAWLGSGVDLPLPFVDVTLINPAPLRDLGVGPLLGLWIGMCTELAIRPVLFVIRYLSGKWAEIRV